MRRPSTAIFAAISLAFLGLAPGAAARAKPEREADVAIQPVESERGLVLFSGIGRARVEGADGVTVISLHEDEQLTTLAETRAGWIAAGVGQDAEGSRVFFVADEAAGLERLPPIVRRQTIQLVPVLLARDGELLGAAWLEGEDHASLAIRFADWNGAGWSKPVTVSRPGPGSQTGLTGAALRDDRLLLVWSRFDGRDDELFWSARGAAAWSLPARVGLDNDVPDITARLAADPGGATLIWARRDRGEYRVLSRRFEADRWGPESAIGPRGSVHPGLVRKNDDLFAVFRTARPKGWSVAELGGERAALTRYASLQGGERSAPVLTSVSASELVLEWASGRRSIRLPWRSRRP